MRSPLNRRGLLGAAAALLALLAGKPVKAGKAPNPNPPNNPPNNPGNSQPGNGQKGPLGSGPNGQPGPSQDCQDQCQERYEGCVEPCDMNPASAEFCLNRCATQRSNCVDRCPTA